MLSPLLQKLLFVRQFNINEGKIEILGDRYIMLNSSNLIALQEIDQSQMYSIMKNSSLDNLKSIVDHAKVYKNIKDESLKNIAELTKKIGATEAGVIKTLQSIFEIYGLGKLEILRLDNKKFEVSLRIRDSTIALERIKKSKKKIPACTLTAGVLAGIFTYIFGKNVECVEKKCIAKGDEFCDFEVGES